MQVEAGGDGGIHFAQCGEAADLFLASFEKVGTVNGISCNFSECIDQADVIGTDLVRYRHGNNKNANGFRDSSDRKRDTAPAFSEEAGIFGGE